MASLNNPTIFIDFVYWTLCIV